MDEPKDNIENFFERRLKSADFPFREEDWGQLESRLDAADAAAVTASSGRSAWLWGILIIIAFVAGWLLSDLWRAESNSDTMEEAADISSVDQNVPAENQEIQTDEESDEMIFTEPSAANATNKNDQPAVAESQVLDSEPVVDNLSSNSEGISGDTELQNAGINLNETDYRISLKHVPLSAPDEPFTTSPKAVAEREMDALAEENDKKGSSQAGRFGLGIAYSPDLNSTGLNESWKVSSQLGVIAYLKLNRRIEVNTGLLYAAKDYVASGNDYSPPSGYWDYFTNGEIPDLVNATCGIIDIPVNVSFTLNPSNKVQVFAGTGLSNFILLNESYSYEFTDSYGDYAEGWETSDNSAAWGAYWNISAGIEAPLFTQWQLRVEPYLRIPLRGVGYGKVDLYGTGVLFVLKRKFKSGN